MELVVVSRWSRESKTGWVSIDDLVNLSNKEITVQFGFSIRNSKDEQVVTRQTSNYSTFGPMNTCFWTNFAKRSKLLDSLVDGTLVFEVHMKPFEPIKAALTQFIPENPFCNNMLQMFNDKESADIVFEVGKHQSKNNAEKVAKIATVTFHAHRVILKACSAVLADLCNVKSCRVQLSLNSGE